MPNFDKQAVSKPEPTDLETLLSMAKKTEERLEQLESDIKDITNGLKNIGRIWRD